MCKNNVREAKKANLHAHKRMIIMRAISYERGLLEAPSFNLASSRQHFPLVYNALSVPLCNIAAISFLKELLTDNFFWMARFSHLEQNRAEQRQKKLLPYRFKPLRSLIVVQHLPEGWCYCYSVTQTRPLYFWKP